MEVAASWRLVPEEGSNPPSPCCAGRAPRREWAMTCGFVVPVVTVRAHRDPSVTDAMRTQRGPATQWMGKSWHGGAEG
jgi:hypothetical protein